MAVSCHPAQAGYLASVKQHRKIEAIQPADLSPEVVRFSSAEEFRERDEHQ